MNKLTYIDSKGHEENIKRVKVKEAENINDTEIYLSDEDIILTDHELNKLSIYNVYLSSICRAE